MLALASVARVPDYDAPAFPLPLFVRRLFSLSGVVPLGVFLVLHAVTNFRAVRGESAFLATVRLYERIPALPLIEALFVFAPLAVHAALGLWSVAARRPLHEASPYSGEDALNVLWSLQTGYSPGCSVIVYADTPQADAAHGERVAFTLENQGSAAPAVANTGSNPAA